MFEPPHSQREECGFSDTWLPVSLHFRRLKSRVTEMDGKNNIDNPPACKELHKQTLFIPDLYRRKIDSV